ncbi:hypothetical protein [Clostridium sp. FP1]|uniref:hypothetical protein n=1 Tax=Clostridium sp. FP1 TaxID=2724076 RepID=UPI0013E90356|nr:hypothetical protein [Clostridium sp. FP1]MBZ9637562.1 hypothetical protein [Clostridium sp. FP1]
MNKKFLWIICITIVIGSSFFTAFKVKNSFLPSPTLKEEKKINPSVAYSWHDDESFRSSYPYFTLDINDLTDIETASDLILEVEPVDDGTLAAYSLLRKCKVINTFKGKLTENTIYLYENSYFYHSWNYFCNEGYINMKKDEKYIVFLNKIENSDKVEKPELRNGYIFTTPRFGKYEINHQAKLVEHDPDKDEIHFNDIADLPVFLNKKSYVDTYNNILNDIERKYFQ